MLRRKTFCAAAVLSPEHKHLAARFAGGSSLTHVVRMHFFAPSESIASKRWAYAFQKVKLLHNNTQKLFELFTGTTKKRLNLI